MPTTIPETVPSCANCRFHSKQTREEPLYFEEGGDQIRTTDVVVYICMNSKSPQHEKGVKDPITCTYYAPFVSNPLPDGLQAKLDAALARLSRPR